MRRSDGARAAHMALPTRAQCASSQQPCTCLQNHTVISQNCGLRPCCRACTTARRATRAAAR